MRQFRDKYRPLLRLGLEIGLYTVIVVAYIFLILQFFTGLLIDTFKADRVLYAALALGLVVFQGILLEALTTFLIDRLEL